MDKKFRIMKKYVFEKKIDFLTFPKIFIGFESGIFFTQKNFEQNSFEWNRIMKKYACEICIKFGAKKSQQFRIWTCFKKVNQ